MTEKQEKPTKENPRFAQIKGEKGEFFYQKEWYENGARKRKRITDKEYSDALKNAKATGKEISKVEEKPKDVPKPAAPKTEKVKEEKVKKEKTPKEIVPSHKADFSKMPAVSQDGIVTEAIGKITKIVPIEKEEEGSGVSGLYIDIKAGNKEFKGIISPSGPTLQIASIFGEGKNIQEKSASIFHAEDIDGLKKMLNDKIKSPDAPTLLFRIIEEENEKRMYAILTDRWVKVKIQDLMPMIEKAFKPFPKTEIKVHKDETGLHGGKCTVTLGGQSEVLDLMFMVNAGKLDGFHSCEISAGCKILSCLNRLTFDHSKIPGLVNAFKMSEKKDHSGTLEDFITSLQSVLDSSIGQIADVLKSSKEAKVSDAQQKDILTYFMALGRMSGKDYEESVKRIGDKKVEQVTGTMYGLAMNVSFRGSHDEGLSDNKRSGISTVAGEILLVSRDVKKYLEIIEEPVKTYKEMMAKKAEEQKIKDAEKEKKKAAETKEKEKDKKKKE
jgi:hypothetical protein